MSVLRRWRSLAAGDRRLLTRAFGLTLAVRLSLWLVPFRHLRRFLRTHRRSAGPSAPTVERIAWAVSASARRIPDATCLTQALVAEILLHGAGHESVLHLGVARPADGTGLDAHAWVESEGEVVVGGGELERYTRLPVAERWRR